MRKLVIKKKYRIERCREVIDRNRIDVFFGREDLEEFRIVTGMAHIEGAVKRQNRMYPSSDDRHVHIIAHGKEECRSWRKEINGESKEQETKKALRGLIRGDLSDFMSSIVFQECVKCGAVDDLTVDHISPSFDDIVKAFFASEGGYNNIQIESKKCGEGPVPVDPEIEERWIAFHRKRAEYQILCRSCNAKKGSKPSSHLRPYQQDAFDACTSYLPKSVMPVLLELATGAGKSHIAAAIAGWIWEQQKKRVLCLQPSKELTEQNWEKYVATGNKASIFSASAGSKCLRHPVVYGTPGTVKNSLKLFGDQFGAVIIDEAHGVTPTIKEIVEHLKKKNPNIRIIGMTATPYRMGTGYIYAHGIDGAHVGDDKATAPYFHQLLYRITTRELVMQGFLTIAHADPAHAEGYDASRLALNSRGKFEAAEVEQVFEGRGRLTAQIVADVVEKSAGRMGVMIFAATVDHAKEIMESLPPDNARMIGGDVNMGKKDRAALIADFKAMRFKYIVSVGTLTTGFDAPHVDVIAVLRKTESPGLFQQIIGRGLRLHDQKADCMVLDYAGNVQFHDLQHDLFEPQISVKGKSEGVGGDFPVVCPECGFENLFLARKNEAGYGVDDEWYFVDEYEERVQNASGGYIPAFYGRRCCGQVRGDRPGIWERCHHRWFAKACHECGHQNDMAARYCEECKAELVDPNKKLQIEYAKVKADPYKKQTDAVLDWSVSPTISRAGNPCIKVDFVTEYRRFSIWLMPAINNQSAQRHWEMFSAAIFDGHIAPDSATLMQYLHKARPPVTVTYKREKDSQFYRVFGYNAPADAPPQPK